MFKGRSARGEKRLAAKPASFRQNYFGECHRTYSCIHCRAHLANHDELISKLFQGNHGRAYLFNKVVNVGCRQAVQRELLTGLHAVADIYCDSCETTLGWKYEQAFVPSQKYKEGKYIIELVHILKENNWDLTSYNARQLLDEAEAASRRKLSAANNRYALGCGSGSPRTPVRQPCSSSSIDLASRSMAGLRLAPDTTAESVPGSPCSQSDASSLSSSGGATPPPALDEGCSALASH